MAFPWPCHKGCNNVAVPALPWLPKKPVQIAILCWLWIFLSFSLLKHYPGNLLLLRSSAEIVTRTEPPWAMQSDNRAPSAWNGGKTCWFLASWEPLPLAPWLGLHSSAWCLGWGAASRLFPLSRKGDAVVFTRQDAGTWPSYLYAAGLECNMVCYYY